ncbi:MAG: VWA domain-containing protein [Acidobacteria bacterium]|nr:VWA domain-containing protein [Acidobacteriota bacterium]
MTGTAFADNLVHFVRYLRAQGLTVGPSTARDLGAVTSAVGLLNKADTYHAFKAVTVVRPSEVPMFDQAFELFFGTALGELQRPSDIRITTPKAETAQASLPTLSRGGETRGDDQDDEVVNVGAGSYSERLSTRDFATLTPSEREEVRRLIAEMVWRPADAKSRRWVADSRGTRPHLRRTLRNLTGPDGDLMPLEFSSRRPRRRPLIILADISGSMERYAEMFLHFVHAAQGHLGRVESFVFGTRLTRITRDMRQRDPSYALARVSVSVEDWSGGTRIGEAFERFNLDWSRRLARGGAIALIMSDGWDTGDPDLLEEQMARFSRSVHRVVWLNPLASRPGFAPEARGMRTVLPYVDDFLAASSVMDLRGVVRLLESLPLRRS